MNRYSYVENRPNIFIDPSGLSWIVRVGAVSLGGCKDLKFSVRHDFSFSARDLPRPEPIQVWVLNKQTTVSLDKDCKWTQHNNVLILDDGSVVKQEQSFAIDVWTFGKSGVLVDGEWRFEDNWISPLAGVSDRCLVMIKNEKKIGFNANDKTGRSIPIKKEGMSPMLKADYDIIEKSLRPPFGYLTETYFQFNKKNCGNCLTDCVNAWVWQLVPDCITCLVFSEELLEIVPRRRDPIVSRGHHICRPRGPDILRMLLPLAPPM